MLLSFIPYIGVGAGLGRARAGRSRRCRVAYTLQYYERVIVETPKYIVNSFLYSGLAVVDLHRGRRAHRLAPGALAPCPGRGALDALNTLILAIPGTAIGIAYVRAFHFDLPGLRPRAHLVLDRACRWCSRCAGCPTRCAARTPRCCSCTARWRRPRRAWAPPGSRTFRDITLPLIWKGVLVGGLFSFMTSLQEASAVLFLALGGWETITNGIFAFYIAGSANEAAALGVILIVVAAVSVAIINRIAGTRMGGVFG